jgi:methionine synthase II (cobalamin-independent)
MAPPFHADHVGSLLRPAAIREARAKRAKGEIGAAALAEIEDREIARCIARQEEIGLKAVTDGEYRRYAWMTDFLAGLDGAVEVEVKLPLPGGGNDTMTIARITGKLGFSGHPMLDHFRFLAAHTKVTPKISIPSPSMLISVLRDWREGVSETAYPRLEDFRRDVGAAYRDAVRAFAAAGCTYLQIDDCNLAYLCDPTFRERIKGRGLDPDQVVDGFVETINAAIAGKPAGMTVATHVCRGNFRSTWFSRGGYEPVAEALFNRIGVDAYFLEYDSERAGGFDPLRFVPKNKIVVLGLVTSKTPELEPKDTIKRRIDEAAKYVPLERLCLSPQCGFASTEHGNVLTEDQQWAKLAHVVAIARDVWGEV